MTKFAKYEPPQAFLKALLMEKHMLLSIYNGNAVVVRGSLLLDEVAYQ